MGCHPPYPPYVRYALAVWSCDPVSTWWRSERAWCREGVDVKKTGEKQK